MDFELVYAEYANMLFRICMLYLQNEQDAKDIMQDTFLSFLEKQNRIKESAHVKAWLIRVSLNKCHDLYRRRKTHPEISFEEIEKYVNAPEEVDIVSEIMKLPEKLKITIYLYYVEGYQIKEIAKLLQITEFSVKKRLQRGREQLKLSLEQ